MTEQKRLKSALFVDFDNIYLGLRQLDEDAAEQFASNPTHWLQWLEEGMPGMNGTEELQGRKRDILIRQCYLNPRGFQQYRPYFTRSAFSVVDCPSLTSQGKNSADIYMVMDMLDTLNHSTHFDEFIIFSGDTDFMPVMLRLREYDRRTTILSAGPAAAAFLAAANQIISEDVFIEHALGVGGEEGRKGGNGAVASTATPELLDAMAENLYAEASANGEILATHLPKLYRNFPEFRRDSNWLGFFSLRALTTHLSQRHPNLRITEGDPWRVTVQLPRRSKAARPSGEKAITPSKEDKLRRRIVDLVRRLVADAKEPILMGRAAQEVINRTGQQVLKSHWAGAGTFKNLLQSEENLGFEIATSPSPGYLYDPERHSLPREEETVRKGEEVPPKLAEFSKRISSVTGAPNLSPRQYAMIFTALAEDLKEHPYHLTSTSKAVRDRVIEQGESISRANINNVLKGIAYAKHRFSKRDTPQSLARVYRSYILGRCDDAELALTREDKRMLREWIEGGLRALSKKKDEKKNGGGKSTALTKSSAAESDKKDAEKKKRG